ncbi:MAG: phosphoglucosamine mutase [Actinobacteria bacterium]|nr:phosphoglucosamine mutase [Actinomycetota bacterium]
MSLRFGTDGVRGVANAALTPEFVTSLGRAAARGLGADICAIGRDTRVSGTMLVAALAAGLTAEGVDVVDLGVVPTPAVAYWAQQHGQPGAVISASHNPYPDNGVKFFAEGGRKLSDAAQASIEAHLTELLEGGPNAVGDDPPVGDDVGVVRRDNDAGADYIDHLVDGKVGERGLEGALIVVDAANGAASAFAAKVFGRIGATVTVVNASPDGVNINEGCGSTHPEALQRAVVDRRARFGLALDGDADRLLAVDERGALVDGDALLAVFALDLAARGRLRGPAIVATVMSNLGLQRALARNGIDLVRCDVGDRNVLAELDARGLDLGGEQSGHLIFADHATTGDGLLAGVLLADLIVRSGRPLSELASVVTPVPQVLRNVPLPAGVPDLSDAIAADVAEAEARLGDDGRVLIRLSGTEPLARVMVEATEAETAERVADALVAAVERTIG